MAKLIYRSSYENAYKSTINVSVFESEATYRVMPIRLRDENFGSYRWKMQRVALPYLYHILYLHKERNSNYRYEGMPQLQIFCRNSPLLSLNDRLFRFPLEEDIQVCTPHEFDGIHSPDLDKLSQQVMGIWYGMRNPAIYRYYEDFKDYDLEKIVKQPWEKYDFSLEGHITQYNEYYQISHCDRGGWLR